MSDSTLREALEQLIACHNEPECPAIAVAQAALAADDAARASRAAAPQSVEPVALTDERINYIADLVVKGMPEGISGFCKSWGWQQFARALLADCRAHLSTRPVRTDEWIACSERMPDEGATCLVALNDGTILSAWPVYWHGASNAFAQWSFPIGEWPDAPITHWRPLPAPPTKKEQP